MSDLSNFGQRQENSGTSKDVYTLPIPPLNDEGVLAAYAYLDEVGEAHPGQDVETLQDLCYRLTVELARARSLLRLERGFYEDLADELNEAEDIIEFYGMSTGREQDQLRNLMSDFKLIQNERDAYREMVDWDGLLDDQQ